MKLLFNVSRKGFTVSRLPGQESQVVTSLMQNTSFDYERKVNGYQSAIIMACMRWIQRTFPEAPLMLSKRDTEGSWEEVYSHKMLDMADSPNPYYDGILLEMATLADFVLDGNAYWYKLRSAAGRTAQLWWLPSSTVEPKWPRDGTAFLTHYDYRPGAAAPLSILPEDIVHFRDGFDPSNIRKGMSPLKSLFREVFTDDEAANMTAALMKNLGIPGLVISPAGAGSASTADAKELKQWFKDNFTGDKRGDPLVMSSATDVKPFGFTPKDMTLRELRRIPEERISAVLGVPAIVAGLGAGLDRSTYSNYAEAREAAYESTIIPLQRIMASVIKRQFLREYETDLQSWKVGFDLSGVRILQEDENKKTERINSQVVGGVLKVKDAQKLAGVPVDDTQDFYLRPYNLMAVTSGPAPEPSMTQDAKSERKQVLFDEQVKETFWQGYAMKAENSEKAFIASLRQMFAKQQKEAIKNLRRRDNLIDQHQAQEDYKEIAAPVLTDLMAEAITNAQDFLEGHRKQESLASQAAIIWLRTRIGWVAEQVGEETAHLLSVKLAEGFAQGEGIAPLTKRVQEVFGFCSKVRATRIARTETIGAAAQGTIISYKDAGVSRVEFLASPDTHDCACVDLAGQEFPIDDSEGIIPVHPNCLLPDNEVLPLGLVGASRAFYSGEAIELITRKGHKLTVTPNHPILTPDGFVKAQFLKHGDCVISSLDGQRIASSINPDDEHVPTPIEDVWNTLIMQQNMMLASMPVSPEDFHGEARAFDGDIDIVYPDSLLLNKIIDASFPQHISQNAFNSGNMQSFSLDSSGMTELFAGSFPPSPHGDMCRGCNLMPFLRRHLGYADNVSLATGTGFNPNFNQSPAYGIAGNVKRSSKGKFGLASEVTGDNFGFRQGLTKLATRDATAIKESVESRLAYIPLAKQFLNRFTGLVSADEIINVRYFKFSGHVYDLQSMEQLYIGSGIVVKNCRCTWLPVIEK